MNNQLDQNTILTREVLERKKNLFEFLLVDKPFPADSCPRREDTKHLIFLNISECLMEQMLDCFRVRDLFDYYGITNYSTEPDLRELMENLDKMITSLKLMPSIDELRDRFGETIDWLLAGKPRIKPDHGLLNDHWREVIDDFVRVFLYLKSYCWKALETEKTVAIPGM